MVQGTHGTYRMYAAPFRCRCDACRAYQNDRVARNRADRLASGNLNHGTRSAYDAGCKCGSCRLARRAAYLENERQLVEAEPERPRHNHFTRDMKMDGSCPACEWYWKNQESA